MRLSHQGFASNGLNSSLGINMQQPGIDNPDLNNSGIPTTANTNAAASKTAKQWMNTSFDASKSANALNPINYVSSAYMSAIPTHSTQGSANS